MSARPPLSVRLALALFQAATRLLPASFRDAWLTEAAADLERALQDDHARAGTFAVARGGLAAVTDVLVRAPGEWWAASGGRPPTGGVLTPIRQSARALARRPGYALAAVTTLALGIGATVTIFTLVDAVLIRPLPYEDSDRLVTIHHHAPGIGIPQLEQSPGMIHLYRTEADFLEDVTAYDVFTCSFSGGGGEPARVRVLFATPELFQALRVSPALGRAFDDRDAAEDAPRVALLTHRGWGTHFGFAPGVIGRTARIDGVPTEIIGVLPEGFVFADPRAVALAPYYVEPNGPFGAFQMTGFGRLADGVTLEQAQARLDQLQALVPDLTDGVSAEFLQGAGWSASVERLRDDVVSTDVAEALWIVFAAVGFVLLIACANVANLFLVRAEARRREVALRTALGGGRVALASLFFGEAFLLAVAGGVAGAGLAWGGVEVLVAKGPSAIPRLHEVAVGARVIAFAVAVSVLATLVVGALPVFRSSRSFNAMALGSGGRSVTDGRERQRARNVLVVAQFGMALVLLIASGLMLRTFGALQAVEAGFDPSDVLVTELTVDEELPNEEAARFYQEVADRVAASPGVRSVGLATVIPIGGGSWNGGSFHIESKPRGEGELPPVASYIAIGAEYLDALDYRLVVGRKLRRSDWEGREPVALVNETFERLYLNGDALGEGIRWDEDGSFARIVGVVADARERGLREEVDPLAYLPMIEGDWGYPALQNMALFVESERPEPTVHVGAVRDAVRALHPTVPMSFRTMDEVVARSIAGTSFTLALIAIAATVALFLGAVGLFGVLSYVVAQRTREIGVRVALGAQVGDIRSLVLRQAGVVAVVGLGIGVLGALAVTRAMGSLLFGVTPTDPLTFAAALGLLGAVSGVAAWLPAHRASSVDPVRALTAE